MLQLADMTPRFKVTLWEYIGPAPAPAHNKIAVKLTDQSTTHLRDEGILTADLARVNSEHIVDLLVNPATIITTPMRVAEGLPLGWVVPGGRVRRLIMEYVSPSFHI